MSDKRKVLVAPLDWGLGHGTRCIPIIQQLLSHGFEVILAADGAVKTLLQLEFPQITILHLDGYHIKYAHTKTGLLLNMLNQIPDIIKKINYEHKWLKNVINIHKINIVISDNRYGLHNKEVYSIFITHQLLIKSPLFQKGLQAINYRYINRFKQCWVPDYEGTQNLSGILSHPKKKPSIPLKYIGPLSRFSLTEQPSLGKYLLILLSGPEPQRTVLETILLAQLKNINQNVLVVRGLPGNTEELPISDKTEFINHLPAAELQLAIREALFIIARTGYSTVMDLIKMKKKSILIPTPGQTEQEYLGEHLKENNLALCMPQQNFNLAEALKAAASYPYKFFTLPENDLLKGIIEQLKNKVETS